ncbi:MAG: peptidoglycan-binding protein [Stellaceae bacterium]
MLAVAAVMGPCWVLAPPARAQQGGNYGTYGTDQHACDQGALAQVLSTSKSNILGSAAGAALGGLLGNQIGKGSGNTLATIAGVFGGALAGGYVGRSMDPSDQACVATTLQNAPTNQTVAWKDPSNNRPYWVTPTRDYRSQNGEPCRDYILQSVENGNPQNTRDSACLDRNGTWRSAAQQPSRMPYQQGNYAPPQRQTEVSSGSALSRQTVLEIQERLWRAGDYRGASDGIWGPNTARALQQFQSRNGLTVTGQLDSATVAALGLNGNSGPPPR